MNLELFMLGVKIGLSVAMPVGPLCLLCIRKSLTDNLAVGISLALGVATADMVYAILGALGISTLSLWLDQYKSIIEIIGVLVIIYLGITILKNRVPPSTEASCSTGTLLQTYFSIIALTLTSPMTIALFAGVFAGIGPDIAVDNYLNLAQLSAGVFVSTALWFTSVSATIIFFKSWFNKKHLVWLNIVTGSLILLLGCTRLYNIILRFI